MDPGTHRRRAYHVVRRIGQGTHGVVNEAIEMSTGKTYAIKSIVKNRFNDSSKLAEFVMREISNLVALPRHVNVIGMREWFETSKKFYIVFEMASGGELFDRIVKRSSLTEPEAANVIFQLLSALSHLHQHNIIHRDIKPENILYKTSSADSPIVLADFGVSIAVDEEDDPLMSFCGSPAYVSPEMILGTGYGFPSDIWAVGVCAYTMVMGYGPWFHCKGKAEMYSAIVRGDWEFEAPYADALSEDGKRFIQSLMQLDPDLRPEASIALTDPWLLKNSLLANNLIPQVPTKPPRTTSLPTITIQPPPPIQRFPTPPHEEEEEEEEDLILPRPSTSSTASINRTESKPPTANILSTVRDLLLAPFQKRGKRNRSPSSSSMNAVKFVKPSDSV
ncbi:hypothetical protein HDU67_004725, partial [Dinochytrium kinnereticum]